MAATDARVAGALDKAARPFICCIDAATNVGLADGRVGDRPRHWSWDLRDGGATRGARLLQLWNFLGAYLTETRVDRLCVEAPMAIAIMNKIGADDDTVQMLRGVVAVVELAAAAHEIECHLWNVQDARQAVLGRRTFPTEKNPRTGKKESTAKREVMKGCRTLRYEPDDDNQADAIVGFLYESALLNPRTALMTAPLFADRGRS